jgi:hypothetical protein
MQITLTLHRRKDTSPGTFSGIVLVRSDSPHVQDFHIEINLPIKESSDENFAEVRRVLTKFAGQFGPAIQNLQFIERRRNVRD